MMTSEVDERGKQDSVVLAGLRHRGQFLISGLLWAAAGGLLIVGSSYVLVLYHYAMSFAERSRASLGFARPIASPDWFMLIALTTGPILCALLAAIVWNWYRKVWFRRLRRTWPNRKDRWKYSRWEEQPLRATAAQRTRSSDYLAALLRSDQWSAHSAEVNSLPTYEARAEWLLTELEKDVAERALTTGLTVGISRSRFIDLFTIFAAALELQLHVLSRLGKRPSWHAWRILIQRCGASLFINSYLNRQDSLALNLLIKKAGMGLQAAGDLMENTVTHLSESDVDLDEA